MHDPYINFMSHLQVHGTEEPNSMMDWSDKGKILKFYKVQARLGKVEEDVHNSQSGVGISSGLDYGTAWQLWGKWVPLIMGEVKMKGEVKLFLFTDDCKQVSFRHWGCLREKKKKRKINVGRIKIMVITCNILERRVPLLINGNALEEKFVLMC